MPITKQKFDEVFEKFMADNTQADKTRMEAVRGAVSPYRGYISTEVFKGMLNAFHNNPQSAQREQEIEKAVKLALAMHATAENITDIMSAAAGTDGATWAIKVSMLESVEAAFKGDDKILDRIIQRKISKEDIRKLEQTPFLWEKLYLESEKRSRGFFDKRQAEADRLFHKIIPDAIEDIKKGFAIARKSEKAPGGKALDEQTHSTMTGFVLGEVANVVQKAVGYGTGFYALRAAGKTMLEVAKFAGQIATFIGSQILRVGGELGTALQAIPDPSKNTGVLSAATAVVDSPIVKTLQSAGMTLVGTEDQPGWIRRGITRVKSKFSGRGVSNN